MVEEIIQLDSSTYLIFILAIRSPVTKEKYLQRIGYFLTILVLSKEQLKNAAISLVKKQKVILTGLPTTS
jgi:hypothetical protein